MNPYKYKYYKLNWDLIGGKKKKDSDDDDSDDEKDSDKDSDDKEKDSDEDSDDSNDKEDSDDKEEGDDKEEEEDSEDEEGDDKKKKDKKDKKEEAVPESFRNEVLTLIKSMSIHSDKIPQIMSTLEILQKQMQEIKKEEDKIVQHGSTPPNSQTSTPIINNVISPFPQQFPQQFSQQFPQQFPMQQMGNNQNPMNILATQPSSSISGNIDENEEEKRMEKKTSNVEKLPPGVSSNALSEVSSEKPQSPPNEETSNTNNKPTLPPNVIVKNDILYDMNTNKPVNLKGENLPPKYIMRPNGKLEQT